MEPCTSSLASAGVGLSHEGHDDALRHRSDTQARIGDVEAELAKGRAATRLEVEEKLRAESLGPVAALKQDQEHNPNALLLTRSELGL